MMFWHKAGSISFNTQIIYYSSSKTHAKCLYRLAELGDQLTTPFLVMSQPFNFSFNY